MILPLSVFQDTTLQLNKLFEAMLPMANNLTHIAQGIAGLGALFYIALRVWSSMARAEPIDYFSLLRPFAIGLAIILFVPLVRIINGILEPINTATEEMVVKTTREGEAVDFKFDQWQKELEEANKVFSDQTIAMVGTGVGMATGVETLGVGVAAGATMAAGMYGVNKLNQWWNSSALLRSLNKVATILCQAIGMGINVIRTFFLIVLTILGPIIFGISVWDGLSGGISTWFSKYISVWLWLPTLNILNAILVKLQIILKTNIMQNNASLTFSSIMLIFSVVSIMGFFAVPTVAGWIVANGGGLGSYGRAVSNVANSLGMKGASLASGASGGALGHVTGVLKKGMGAIKGNLMK